MAEVNTRGVTVPYGVEVRVDLGVSQEEYDRILRVDRSIDVRLDPRWHSHPVLGITGHMHPNDEGLHTHVPEVIWGAAVALSEPSPSAARQGSETTEGGRSDG